MNREPARREAILLMGPTGAGKSELALQVAEHLPVEIISVDSAMVYRGMDIGTAKPGLAARGGIPHHLIDIRDATEVYSAGDFVLESTALMQGIWERGRVPLLVGGTMLYFHALSAGIADLPEGDVAVRAAIDAQGAAEGWAAVHAELARVDPLAAGRIHVNDPQRIQRALEVFRITGAPISRLQQARVSALADVKVQEFALAPLERSELHLRITRRFESMLKRGLLDEVRQLLQRGDLTAEHPSMRAVGYRQLWQHLQGQTALHEATNQAIAATRQLAKRQFTWLRRRQQAQWVDSVHPLAASNILSALSKCGIGTP
jgi:tRNA dimethylallyltransferase